MTLYPSDMVEEQVRPALEAAQGITLLRGVLDDEAGRALLELLRALAGEAGRAPTDVWSAGEASAGVLKVGEASADVLKAGEARRAAVDGARRALVGNGALSVGDHEGAVWDGNEDGARTRDGARAGDEVRMPDAREVARAYGRAFHALAEAANAEETVTGLRDAWQAYLLTRILDDSNPWSRQAEMYGAQALPAAIRGQAQRDLRALRRLFELSAEQLWRAVCAAVADELPGLADAWVPWYDLAPPRTRERLLTARDSFARRMAETRDWGELVDALAEHWARQGTGPFACYHVFRWEGREEGLRGVAYPDPVRLENLVGYAREQGRLRANTERFLAGLPAHDVVLYGAPGTGKSSTVKALANAYADRGLRLVEVRKEFINDLPRVIELLRGRAPRFLLFIDDLSFEEHETEYKALKVLLEGSVEARPANVLVYATSNRLNLIRENFSDRGRPTDDIHWKDTMDEKNSLVARFGLRITFLLPDQERYLQIVRELAQQRGLGLDEEELRGRALLWERQRSGRSGRTARQFVDDLEAELKAAR